MKSTLTPAMRAQLREEVFEHNNCGPALLEIHSKHGDATYRLACREALALLHEKLSIPQGEPTHFGCHVENYGYGRVYCVLVPMAPIRPGESTFAAEGSALIHPCQFVS